MNYTRHGFVLVDGVTGTPYADDGHQLYRALVPTDARIFASREDALMVSTPSMVVRNISIQVVIYDGRSS